MPRRAFTFMMTLMMPFWLASCGTVRFYSQAVHGQTEILHKARPIACIEADPLTTDKLRRQLKLVTELKNFARKELRLPVTKQFGTYADLGRPYVVLNVYAASEFSVDAKSWWYPFIGRAKYRGFFNEKLARQEAEKLKSDGLDVTVGGVRVYSTLGWFADPVLNTFIGENPAQLAETIFHELTHARVFIGGDSDFNEAFATANAQEGVRRWLRVNGDAAALARYELGLRRDEKLLALLTRTRASLKSLYNKKDILPVDVLRQAKARVLNSARLEYAAMKLRGEIDSIRDGWFGQRLNNALLASIATYYELVPGFRQTLRDNGGDLEKFYETVAGMKRLGKAERRKKLQIFSSQDTSAAPARS